MSRCALYSSSSKQSPSKSRTRCNVRTISAEVRLWHATFSFGVPTYFYLSISAVQITAKLTKSTKSHAGAIAGGIIGSLAALLAIVLVMWCRRRRSGSVEPLFNFNFLFERNC